ncbi:MAG: HAD family phosphatase [Candidatus Micrarchaeota archaeon]|nr:HAD family phosphatase [Candidatus Micrarchaeota archaeon]MDE1847545.1 HAD family phosphatase [Candidatus Micrarchaeota archaeon]MDE1864262.1 HAD family phosphatase [Candidatus Micrarchaeota archaeon]
MIKCILFDLGGVLIDFSDEQYIKYLAEKSGMGEGKVERLVDPLWKRMDSGDIHVKSFEKGASKLLGIGSREASLLEFYKSRVRSNKPMLQLALSLSRSYTLAFLSNVDRTRYGISSGLLGKVPFSYRFVSSVIGLRKPDPKVYRYVLKKMRMKSSEVLFIDNQTENVAGARRVGIKSILFTDKSALVEALKKRGILR